MTIFTWRPAAWLRVAGADAANFLQGQFSNDLRVLPAVPAVYGLWLTVKGRVLADSFVLPGGGPEEFWLGSYASPAAAIRERLESYVIADDVTVEDVTAEWTGISVLGGEGAEIPSLRGEERAFLFPGRRDRRGGVEWVYRAAEPEPAWVRGAERADASALERSRIAAGIPAIPVDAGPGDLPQEAGLEADAISYTKGCYLGQEVMARLKSLGQVRRRLLRVEGDGPAPAVRPAPVFAAARQVGELRSAVADGPDRWIGLAMVSLLHVAAETRLAFAADGEPVIRWVDSP